MSFDKNVTKMMHQEGTVSVLKTFFYFKNESKFFDFDFILLLLKISESCCVNQWLHSFVYVFVTYIWNIFKIRLPVIFKNTTDEKKNCSGQKTRRLLKFEVDTINTFLNKSYLIFINQICFVTYYLSTLELQYMLKSRMTSISVDSCFNVVDWLIPHPLEFFRFR